ncbi:FeoA family protein [Ideonella sp. BN130291]|uniref:FeoA family protein n=1 Tax=Ideonella sp. BN130291 TaxID=3112940 RepID=UPI002E26748F|nr:FeoA family protein [Ideonella sp. BN130291]
MSILPLSSLPTGTEATVAEVIAPAHAQDDELVLRLIEIGFLPGERLRVIARGQPGDEPIAVRLGHTTFALRRFEAAFIQVETAAVPLGQPAKRAGAATANGRDADGLPGRVTSPLGGRPPGGRGST